MRVVSDAGSSSGDLINVSGAALRDAFWDPPALWRGKPFWSWNGKLEREELLRQIDVLAEMGMGGFFMHSRTGLQTEYLGEEWFELINACVEAGRRQGLSAWLYDEDRWPSGSAGGLATEEERYRMKYLRLTTFASGEDVVWPEEQFFIAAFSGRLEELDWFDGRRIAYRSVETADQGAVLIFSWEYMATHSFYNGNTYLDTLNLEATRHFLEVTHEAYARNCGAAFGHGIEGVFTDEPHRGMIMCRTIAQGGPANSGWATSFTGDLQEQFQQQFGYDLYDHLPDLFLRNQGQRFSPVKWQYVELLQRLFLERWAIPCLEWCRNHGLKLTGHLLHEDTLGAQVIPCGSVMRYYEHMDIPGIDVLGGANRSFWVAKQVVSVARQLGKPLVLSELYGCTGWQMDFKGHKLIGDWQAIQGVNLRCHHLSWYTMRGESKRDYPGSIFFQSGWYREYKYVEDYFARLGLMLAQGEPVCEVLVVNPVESLWGQIHAGWADWLGAITEPVLKLEKQYQELYQWLTGAQIDFDYGDEDHLARFGVIRPGEDREAALLQVGKGRYRTVVVAGMETIRSSTVELLRRFKVAGGTVLFVGEVPGYVDAVPAEIGAFGLEDQLEWSGEAVVGALQEANSVGLRLDFLPEDAEARTAILAQIRRTEEGLLLALVNTAADRAVSRVTVSVNWCGAVEEWSCRDGSISRLEAVERHDRVEWTTSLAAAGERVFRVQKGAGAEAAVRVGAATGEALEITGEFEVSLSEPNCCVLDFAEWRWENDDWQPATEILRIDELLRKRLNLPQRAGDMMQPWFGKSQTPPELGTLSLRFRFRAESVPPAISLALEGPERWRVTLDGALIATDSAEDWFVDPCLQVFPVTGTEIGPGEHVLEMVTRFSASSDLEAVYLLGKFGVVLGDDHGPRLVPLPPRLPFNDITGMGLPFYSGTLVYRLPAASSLAAGREMKLRFPDFGGACIAVRQGEGGEKKIIAFPPYEVALDPSLADEPIFCELFLTRRNTFGPLHQVPRVQPFVAPESFRTHGEAFAEHYQLFPAGILAPPVLVPAGRS